jgi:hypothetical protein
MVEKSMQQAETAMMPARAGVAAARLAAVRRCGTATIGLGSATAVGLRRTATIRLDNTATARSTPAAMAVQPAPEELERLGARSRAEQSQRCSSKEQISNSTIHGEGS